MADRFPALSTLGHLLLFGDHMLRIDNLEFLERPEPNVFEDFAVVRIVKPHRYVCLGRRVEYVVINGGTLDLRPLEEFSQLVVLQEVAFEYDGRLGCLLHLGFLLLGFLPLATPQPSVLLFHPFVLDGSQHQHLGAQLRHELVSLQYLF